MSIKWENIRVLRSPLTNEMYLGKLDASGVMSTDKSAPRTEEIKSTMMAYMDAETPKHNVGTSYTCEAGSLTWIRAGAKNREDYRKQCESAEALLRRASSIIVSLLATDNIPKALIPGVTLVSQEITKHLVATCPTDGLHELTITKAEEGEKK